MRNTMNKIMRNILTALLPLMALGQAGAALAHDQSGFLAAAASSVDYYLVQCYNDGSGNAAHLYSQVINYTTGASVPKVSVQLLWTGTPVTANNIASNSTDPINGDAINSPAILQQGGNGYFYMAVNKTGAGAVTYDVTYHCQTADLVHTGTNITQLVNQ